jgi:hypothetical protein
MLLPLTLYASLGACVTPFRDTISCSALAGANATPPLCKAYVAVALAVSPSYFLNSPVRGCAPIYGINPPPLFYFLS